MSVVWVPYAEWPAQLELPGDVRVDVFDGISAPPSSIGDVEFYVLPYMGGEDNGRLMARMTSLRVAQSLSAGVDTILRHLPEGVTFCNARGVHDASTAELAVALTLAVLRGFPAFVRAAEQGQWAPALRPSLADRRVLLVGYGAVGQAIERRLAGFECDVRRVARHSRDATDGGGAVSAYDDLPVLLADAEVVILTVPLTEDTRGMVDAEFLAALPDGALLVNVARGSVVNTDALLAETSSGRLMAALDVTDPEPLPADHPLWSVPNVLVVPHVGGNTTAYPPRALRLVREQLHRHFAREPLVNVITGTY